MSSQQAHPLIELSEWPTLPAPWSTQGNGETWVWGDYFMLFQEKPETIQKVLSEKMGTQEIPDGIIYHYALTVFYNFKKNPHGPSMRPIKVIACEQANLDAISEMMGIEKTSTSEMGSIMIGMFTGTARYNLGEYDGRLDAESVKTHFFEVMGRDLNLSGAPRKIGTIAQAHGHPDTGLPSKKTNSGCMPVILMMVSLSSFALFGFDII